MKQKKIAAEFDAMKALMANAPFFGCYGGGEIGTESVSGVGFHVATTALFVE